MVQTATRPTFNSPRGLALLDDTALNKAAAFTEEERRRPTSKSLLPNNVERSSGRLKRVLGHLSAKTSDLEGYIYLIGLSDRNETLFYRTVMSDPSRFIPILYDRPSPMPV